MEKPEIVTQLKLAKADLNTAITNASEGSRWRSLVYDAIKRLTGIVARDEIDTYAKMKAGIEALEELNKTLHSSLTEVSSSLESASAATNRMADRTEDSACFAANIQQALTEVKKCQELVG